MWKNTTHLRLCFVHMSRDNGSRDCRTFCDAKVSKEHCKENKESI